MLKKALIFSLLLVLFCGTISAYGPTGHRTIAAVAEKYLSRKAKREINKILGERNLVLISTWADDVKSDHVYDFAYTWHFINLKASETYAESKKNPKGDIVSAVKHCIKTLKDKEATLGDKQISLSFLVHIIGDLHQPLHVGHITDRGGNDIKVKWFGHKTNLHRVWDSDMIDSYKMSYSELANNMHTPSRKALKKLQAGTILDWVTESQELAAKVYASAKPNENLRYRYMYDHFETLRTQLNKGGIRLAKILNDIF